MILYTQIICKTHIIIYKIEIELFKQTEKKQYFPDVPDRTRDTCKGKDKEAQESFYYFPSFKVKKSNESYYFKIQNNNPT